jgi:AcrR family transcriptional regulator
VELTRQRRSSAQVRQAILHSASELFDQRGFQATTTDDISERAKVSKRLIFSHFGSKANLFAAAVTAPFAQVAATYVEGWLCNSHGLGPEERVVHLVNDLYDLARQHRVGLITAIAEANSDPAAEVNPLDELARSFHQLLAVGSNEQLAGSDIPAMLVTTIGMILGAALLDQFLFPTGTHRPSRQRIIDELCATLIGGVLQRTPTVSASRDR